MAMTERPAIVGLIEIAMRAGVKRPVVSTWRTRYENFPEPAADLAVGPIFWWADVERWLKATGRVYDADWTREQIENPWQSGTKQFPRRRRSK